MRFDRFLTLNVAHPLRSVRQANGDGSVPILMYHSISDEAEEGVEPYYRLATNPQRFAEQMQWLRNAGYFGVSLEEALGPLKGSQAGKPLVAITFDDGFRDFHTVAWPVLRRHGFTANMYLATEFISSSRGSFRGKECLTWSEVRELRAQGARFGSHTASHPKLHELSWDAIRSELTVSKECIEKELGEPIDTFAYPYAFPQEDWQFTQRFTNLLRDLGYRSGVTTVLGRARAGDDVFRLKRLPANSCDDEALFIAKLNGAYDWLGSAQRAVRQWKRWTGKSAVRHENGSVAA